MIGVVSWAADRARMVLAFIAMSLVIGGYAYSNLPKEGEPDIEIPALFVSVPFPGISAADSEDLLVKTMESEFADLDGLDKMNSVAAEGYALVILQFDFGWDKTATTADVRDAMNSAQSEFPDGFEQYTLDEFNFSEFPILIVNLTGNVPEREMNRRAKDLQDDIEALDAVLEAGIAGSRDEMVEVLIDPLKLEAYNVTAAELITVVQNNNQLIAAGEIESEQGTFPVKIPASFKTGEDIYQLPVKTNGGRVVTLGELADINLTFEDRLGTARFEGENTVALQVVKRKGYNLIDTVALVKQTVEEARAKWPDGLQAAVSIAASNDQSRQVASMVGQLEGSVLTAIALVMIVVLAALGSRAALLVGFAIPTSFLLCFAFLALMGVAISNMVMFGLILAVGMLVDGAIVVVEYADKRIKEGIGPMHAYVEAAQRMFWPIVSSTATTLCAFLPMLFWPGVAGEFMGMLPVTLIFVLSASLVVALIYLPVVGGVSGRLSRVFGSISDSLRARLPWAVRAVLVPPSLYGMFVGLMQMLNPSYLLPADSVPGGIGALIGGLIFMLAAFAASVTLGAVAIERKQKRVDAGYKRTPFGYFIKFLTGNPIMPFVSIAAVFGAVFYVVAVLFPANSRGVEFFVETEAEQATAFVRARGNLSLTEKDALVQQVENQIAAHPAVVNVFAFAGEGGLDTDASGAGPPQDTVGQVQFEITPWEDRPRTQDNFGGAFGAFLGNWTSIKKEEIVAEYDGDFVVDELTTTLADLPGIEVEIRELTDGPAAAKPVHLRIKDDNWAELITATETAAAHFNEVPGLYLIEDTLPLPGIDWQIDVDVAKAGRYGADVAIVGAMVQLVTRGILLDTMRVDASDDEIEIRVRLPDENRVLSTLDTLKVRTADGLVPLSNFISRKPVPQLAQITRADQQRFFDVKADVLPGLFKVVEPGADGEADKRLAVLQAPEGTETLAGAVFENANGDPLYLVQLTGAETEDDLRAALEDEAVIQPITATERIDVLTEWLNTEPFPRAIAWEWTGDQEEQAESQAFLSSAFLAALGLMFIILLAQFNSFYNSILVLLAVILSTTGVLLGMVIMQQPFSIIMTGTGIVALAGIVVNNNIVLIDTYQEYRNNMPYIEAIIRSAEARIRPVLLTTITTMAGLTPMMFGLSLDFANGGYTIDSPTALWWKQLATAVVFGLGVATVLTLIVTPSLLAIRVWLTSGAFGTWRVLRMLSRTKEGQRIGADMGLRKQLRKLGTTEVSWEDPVVAPQQPESEQPKADDAGENDDRTPDPNVPLRAAE
ncbi:MAG: efflux RND transporter permease subunit [Paracoccaceae bacterium]